MGTVLTGSFPLQQQQQANIMQALIVLSVLGCSFAAPFLQDTPEVVAERARFNQLWQAQAAAAAAAPDPVQSAAAYVPTHNVHHAQPAHHHAQPAHHHAQPAPRWTGPVAATVPVGVQGAVSQVADTADVAAERARFFNAYKAQVAATTGQQIAIPSAHHFTPSVASAPALQPRWTGPMAATVPAGVHGSVAQVPQTADVAQATAAFQQAYRAAVAATTG